MIAYLLMPYLGNGYVGVREAWRIVHQDETDEYWRCVEYVTTSVPDLGGAYRMRFADVDRACASLRPASLSFDDARREWTRRYPG